MKKAVVDFTNVKYYYDLHQILKDSLELPDFYGRNVSALWDCLTGMIETPLAVTLKGFDTLPKDLEKERDFILETFLEAQQEGWDIYITIEK